MTQGTVRQGNMIQNTGYIYRDTQEILGFK
jgi:hypothetical protein